MIRRTALTLSVLATLLPIVGQGLAQARPSKGPVLVYETKRPALDVSITREGDRIVRASVSAPAVCTEGDTYTTVMGIYLEHGPGWPISPAGHFERSGAGRLFRGRFEGDKVIGVFHESHFEVGGSTEGFPPTCGNTRPRGRYQHFVARLVERNHEKVPHSPIRAGS